MSLLVLPSRLRLPREMVVCSLEFLPYAKLLAVMRVSRCMESAAQLVLRVRWRGVEYARTNDVSTRKALRTIRKGGESATGTLILSAWQRDPGDLLLACLTWKRPRDLGSRREKLSGGSSMSWNRCEFLMRLEPSADGIGRVVAACEHPYRTLRAMSRAILAMHRSERPGSTVRLIHDWADHTLDELSDSDEEYDDEKVQRRICRQVGRALEAWADPKLAARFMVELFEIVLNKMWRDDHGIYDRREDSGRLESELTTFSVDWQDRSKAAAFAGTAGQIEADFAIEEAREDMLGGHARVYYH